MNQDQVSGAFKQIQGEAKRIWGTLTDDEITRAEGGTFCAVDSSTGDWRSGASQDDGRRFRRKPARGFESL